VLVHHDLGRKAGVNPYRAALDSCRDTDYLVNPAELEKVRAHSSGLHMMIP
jgi:hypothetical protein